MNIIEIFKRFPTQKKCVQHLEKLRWGDKPFCPYCGSENTNPLVKELRHHCNGCRKSFSVTIGTIFFDSRLPMQKWFLAISLMLNAKKGLSSRQLARDIQVNKDTAWSMVMRIRNAMKEGGELLKGIVEMDETYVGGKSRKKKHDDDDDKPKRGRKTKKIPVVGMIEREGKVKTTAVSKFDLKAKDLEKLVSKGLDLDETILVTDEYKGYLGMQNLIAHLTIN